VFGLGLGSSLVSVLSCNGFISGTDEGMRGGVLFVRVRVAGLFVSFVLIYLSQALIITLIMRVLDCEGFILYLFIVLCDIGHAAYL
jgi:hypothetical protein